MKSRRFRPEALGPNTLESRALLSTVGHTPSGLVSALATAMLSGTQRGTFTARTQPDLTILSTFRATGKAAGLGAYTVAGSSRTLGAVTGHAMGSARLTAKGGTITMSLVGPLQVNDEGLEARNPFAVTVTGGTGKFAGASGSGTVSFHYKTIGKAKNGVARGTVKLDDVITVTTPG